jgi:CPA1 family monovalent cation:H+ antiporter
MENLLQTETVIIELLLIASLVAIVVQRIRLPYTVALWCWLAALALGLPAALGPDRAMIQGMAFGVVLITLLVQATTIEFLLKRLKLVGQPEAELEYERSRGKLLAWRAANEHLTEMYDRGELSDHAWSVLEPELKGAGEQATDRLRRLVETDPHLGEREITSARRELLLLAQRGALHSLQRDGLINSDIFEELTTEIDQHLDRLQGADG